MYYELSFILGMSFLHHSPRTKMVFIITGIFIGLLITVQFRSALPSSSYPYDELNAQKELIKSYLDDQTILKNRISVLRKQIDENQKRSRTTVEKNNLEVLQDFKKKLGLESVRGEGVEIFLDDGIRDSSQDTDQALIHPADLRDIVNQLRIAGAEGIAINDQRIIASTSITSVGNTVLVNNFHLAPPFHIATVGKSEFIVQRLEDEAALPDLHKRRKEKKIRFSAIIKNSLSIPAYNSNLSFKYLQSAL